MFPHGRCRAWPLALLAILLPVATARADEVLLKWDQPPVETTIDNAFYGWNELSEFGGPQIVADDWICNTPDPVTDIHWWGSFPGWAETVPPNVPLTFKFTIWTDVPAGVDRPYSHPGQVLWEYTCSDYSVEWVGWDFDPRDSTWDACFKYNCDLPPANWFYQDPTGVPNIYWISIAAIYVPAGCTCNGDLNGDGITNNADIAVLLAHIGCPVGSGDPVCDRCDINCDGVVDPLDVNALTCLLTGGGSECCAAQPAYRWGWKTRPFDPALGPDAAVDVLVPTDPTIGAQFIDGQLVQWPALDMVWDMAFELTSRSEQPIVKWEQFPYSPAPAPYPNCFYGWDQWSYYEAPPLMADDFLCLGPMPITGIRWWGSYMQWQDPFPPPTGPALFHIAIWTDVPLGDPMNPFPFSHPGTLLKSWIVPRQILGEIPINCDWHPGMMPFPETCFEYYFPIPQPEWFYQEPGNGIYWLSIGAIPPPMEGPPWGWKTRPFEPIAPDFAVMIHDPIAPPDGAVFNFGDPLFDNQGLPWDLAFMLEGTDVGGEILKWSQPPMPFAPERVFQGWNELSVHDGVQIAADDWVCSTDTPVTDIHWWGSFLGWSGPDIPEPPVAFNFAIWTDVPAGADQPFSHPGEVLWTYRCTDFASELVGWDVDPRDPFAPPETCFKFTCILPEPDWFFQDPGVHIYWLSIAAEYPAGTVPMHPFGCKTRPRGADSIAPDDAVRIFAPTAPLIGMIWQQGEPLFWPTPAESWDLAFQLTTQEIVPPIEPKWAQPPHNDGMGFDAASSVWLTLNGTPGLKVVQIPDLGWPGLHADDPIVLADDWLCEGGAVTDLHWWGNYEVFGLGLRDFHLSIHADMGGLPGPALWQADVPITQVNETPLGIYNNEGSEIYYYSYVLPMPFQQQPGLIYWLDISSRSLSPTAPAQWRWQEAGRVPLPVVRLNPGAMRQQAGGPWQPIVWTNFDPPLYSEFAFAVTTEDEATSVNQVVADDFISDGREIQQLRWWGSYFDDRYAPGAGVDPFHVLDGWFLTFHWADINAAPACPPDNLLDPPPTELGIYFAPTGAVQILPTNLVDCFGHPVYEYVVRLDQCCLLCTKPDPRLPSTMPPAQPDAFYEVARTHYWLTIAAETGLTWRLPECVAQITGHVPSDLPGLNGQFWGWHTSPHVPQSDQRTETACVGRLLNFGLPPTCFQFGMWLKQPWLCPTPAQPVNMAFELLTRPCIGDITGDGDVGLSDLGALFGAWNSRPGDPNWNPAADLSPDNHINLGDLGILLSNWDCGIFWP